jgi:dihydrofolate reductase
MRGKKADKIKFISDNVFSEINSFKQAPGKNVMIFGSPTAAHSLMEYNLIDEYWLFVNPILLGQGIPLFANIKTRINLKPLEPKVFPCGVTALHYSIE